MNKQLDYVIEVLEREISGYSDQFAPERIKSLKEFLQGLKNKKPPLTQYQLEEIEKCKNDIVYFTENYIKINDHISDNKQFIPYPHQVNLLRHLQNNNHSICKMSRQSGKTICSIIVLIHELLFSDSKTFGVISHNKETARNVLNSLKQYYYCLPNWMKSDILIDSVDRLVLKNGSCVDSISLHLAYTKGKVFDTILLNEYAYFFGSNVLLLGEGEKEYVDKKGLEQYKNFWHSLSDFTWRCIANRGSGKLILTSTTASKNKRHYFNKLWLDSVAGKTKFAPFEYNWADDAGIDSNWRAKQVSVMGEEAFSIEYECKFDTESP